MSLASTTAASHSEKRSGRLPEVIALGWIWTVSPGAIWTVFGDLDCNGWIWTVFGDLDCNGWIWTVSPGANSVGMSAAGAPGLISAISSPPLPSSLLPASWSSAVASAVAAACAASLRFSARRSASMRLVARVYECSKSVRTCHQGEIRGHQRQSEVVGSNQRSSVAIHGKLRQSEAI